MDLETILENFDAIVELPNGIEQVRSQVLDLAIKGKLVAQDLTDEPASKLLERIQELKLGSSNLNTSSTNFNYNKNYFVIPSNWVWTKLCSICSLITDGVHQTPEYVNSGVPFVSVKDISNGQLELTNCRLISFETYLALAATNVPKCGDILLSKIGSTGIAVEVDTTEKFSIFVSVALLKHFQDLTFTRFLKHLLNSPFVKIQSIKGTEGIGNKNLVLNKISNFIIPLPPRNEQKRIAAKLDQLLNLCDRAQQAKQARDELYKKLASTKLLA